MIRSNPASSNSPSKAHKNPSLIPSVPHSPSPAAAQPQTHRPQSPSRRAGAPTPPVPSPSAAAGAGIPTAGEATRTTETADRRRPSPTTAPGATRPRRRLAQRAATCCCFVVGSSSPRPARRHLLLLLLRRLPSPAPPRPAAVAGSRPAGPLLRGGGVPPTGFLANDYPVASCGLTPAQARKVSTYLSRLSSHVKPDAVRAFLAGIGLAEARRRCGNRLLPAAPQLQGG
jgi:hypothetical protein